MYLSTLALKVSPFDEVDENRHGADAARCKKPLETSKTQRRKPKSVIVCAGTGREDVLTSDLHKLHSLVRGIKDLRPAIDEADRPKVELCIEASLGRIADLTRAKKYRQRKGSTKVWRQPGVGPY